MKFLGARVTNYKCIEDSGWVWFDDVTCLVGKNESGKTAFLQALQRLSPVPGGPDTFDLHDYPRKRLSRYRQMHERRPANAVSAAFELFPHEMRLIEEVYGPGILRSPRVTVRKNYKNEATWDFDIDPPSVILAERIIQDFLVELLPAFVYFDDYALLPGTISTPEFSQRVTEGRQRGSDRTLQALLRLARIDLPAPEHDLDYETLKADLEAASATITGEVLRYWSQNRQLRVQFDLSGSDLHVRIWNDRHQISVPFDERSRGFVWFFSFLAYFSQLDAERADYVFLLDEPGLNLHAQAQKDFLRFIDERLAPLHPVIYTTHSPFLINPARLERVRTVEDVDGRGTVISSDLRGRSDDTLAPVEVAVGYERLRTVLA